MILREAVARKKDGVFGQLFSNQDNVVRSKVGESSVRAGRPGTRYCYPGIDGVWG